MWRRPFLLLLLCVLPLAASAFERPFPPGVKRGTMSPAIHPIVLIDGQERRLSAGAQIRNEDNLIQMPASIHGENLPVHYLENAQNEIDRIWILTPAEASKPLPAQQH